MIVYNLIKINFLLVLLFIAEMSNSQRMFQGFAEVGMTTSQISGDGFYGFGQFGGYAGLGLRSPLSEKWTISGRLALNQKGARKYQNADFTTYRLRVNYVEIPLLLHYSFQQWVLGSGLGVNYRINHRERSMFGDITPERIFKQAEFSFHFMIEYALNENFHLGIGYQNSLLPVRDHASTQVFPPNNFFLGDWHNNLLNEGQYFTSLQLRGTYFF